MKNFYVYIIKCSDNSYYVGVTNDLEKRWIEHIEGKDVMCYTFSRRPLQLVFYELHIDINDAIAREKQIKKWSRAKKEALIVRDIEKLKELSKSKNSSSDA